MMHDREKSDSAIVAKKSANKAGRSAAERMEPRAGTKRNASEQSTHRTQGRARVTQALDRVRHAARQRKKEKFTSLLHHISIELLGEAFLSLKRDAAPGVDKLMWRTYAANRERNLADLHARVHREPTARCHHVGPTSRRLMDASVRWRWPRSRTRSSKERPLRC